MKFATILVGLSLLVSPAIAQECETMEQMASTLEQEGSKIEKTLTGEKLAEFNRKVEEIGAGTPPENQDGLLIISNEKLPVMIGVNRVAGCMQQKAFPIPKKIFHRLFGDEI